MIKNAVFFAILVVLLGCNQINTTEKPVTTIDIATEQYQSFGKSLGADKILDKKMFSKTYGDLKQGDTVAITFISTVNDVCKARGCWMKVEIDPEKESMVKFKDYGFFVPTDIEKDTVIVQGKAFINETSVDELKHYAMDAGKSEEEIAAINTPERTYSFIAEGVLVKN